jgi:hypothetical protein
MMLFHVCFYNFYDSYKLCVEWTVSFYLFGGIHKVLDNIEQMKNGNVENIAAYSNIET